MKFDECVTDFFVYNTTLSNGREENEHEKILFFYPETLSLGEKCNKMGLCEGIYLFTQNFSQHRPLECLHNQKNVSYFYSPEPNLWFVMTLKNPEKRKKTILAPTTPLVEKTEKDKKPAVYIENHWNDNACHVILQDCYKIFRMFYGPIQTYLEPGKDKIELLSKLKIFIFQYLETIDFSNVDIFTAMSGIKFLPLDRNIYLFIHSFLNSTITTFSNVRFCTMLYHDLLVWSALKQEDTRVLYKYLTQFVMKHKVDLGVFGKVLENEEKDPHFILSRFLSLTPTLQPFQPTKHNSDMYSLPTIYLGDEKYTFIIYKYLEVTVFFFVKNTSDFTDDFFTIFDEHLKIPITELGRNIETPHFKKLSTATSPDKYIYFNQMNVAIKTSIKESELDKKTLLLLSQMYDDFTNGEKSVDLHLNEIFLQNHRDVWIVGTRSDNRFLFVVYSNKNAVLEEISSDVKNFCHNQFRNIYHTFLE